MSVITDAEPTVDGDTHDNEGRPVESDKAGTDRAPSARETCNQPSSAPGRATLFGIVVVVALAMLLGWFGFRVHQSHQAQTQRNQLLQVARQGALNLTTIDWHHADADVRRILDGATGPFYDDFVRRSKPFIEVLTQAKATTVGTVTDAGLESVTADTAEALVTVSVQTSTAGEADPGPRAWRMRVTVQKVGGHFKVSNVGFVP